MNNQFLSDFLRMRQALNTVSQSKSDSRPSGGRSAGGGKKKEEIPDRRVTIAYIIEEEPPHKVVREFFRQRIEELTESS